MEVERRQEDLMGLTKIEGVPGGMKMEEQKCNQHQLPEEEVLIPSSKPDFSLTTLLPKAPSQSEVIIL